MAKKKFLFGELAAALAVSVALALAGCASDPAPAPGAPTALTPTPTGSSIEMVSIPGGTFQMGSPANEADRDSDEIQHSVTVSSFNMGKYEVTQEQYQAVMGNNPSKFSDSPADGEVQGKRPVEQVSWYDAIVFCNKLSIEEGLTPAYAVNGSTDPSGWGSEFTPTWNKDANGYRLPTEAEWEYACRAGTTTAYNTGDTISDSTGWYSSNSRSKTHEVGKKPTNAWGLYDMHGNVWEWCWDWYGDYSSGSQTNPQGPSSGSYRVIRGGSWDGGGGYLRSADRSNDRPSSRDYGLGFRLVRP
ncbi:MAG: formylglycine-generating enzyme family protein [Treponema sp.]|nr:formylglycine-generating enzyme family protein [Treponema sp.]